MIAEGPFLECVETNDGLVLHGSRESTAAHKSFAANSSDRAQTALLLVHGTGSNFYHPGVLATFASQAVRAGYDVWRINTRGHDGIASIPGALGSAVGGATYEVVADCCKDLAAWVRHLNDAGHGRVVLVGHSMGAVKSIYYAAKDAPPNITAVIAISPPRFCHRIWMCHPQAGAFRESWEKAVRLVAEERGNDLMSVAQPVPFVATAAGFLAKYGPHDEYDVVRLLSDVSCPTFVMIGMKSVAGSPAFDGLPEALQTLAGQRPALRVETIDGANTGYTGCEHVPFERAAAWLESL